MMPFIHNLEEKLFAIKKDPIIVCIKKDEKKKRKYKKNNKKETSGEVIATHPLLLSTN